MSAHRIATIRPLSVPVLARADHRYVLVTYTPATATSRTRSYRTRADAVDGLRRVTAYGATLSPHVIASVIDRQASSRGTRVVATAASPHA